MKIRLKCDVSFWYSDDKHPEMVKLTIPRGSVGFVVADSPVSTDPNDPQRYHHIVFENFYHKMTTLFMTGNRMYEIIDDGFNRKSVEINKFKKRKR